jgi:hypothetical protein
MFRSNTAKLSADNLHAHRKIVKMLIAIILIFALFGLPGQIMWLLLIDNNSGYFPILSLVDIFSYMYCVLNPVLFFAYNNECYERVRKAFASVFVCCGYHWEVSTQTGTRQEAITTLLAGSRTSDSQNSSGSDAAPRIDPKYAPAIPKYLLEKLDKNSIKEGKDRPVENCSTFKGMYTPVVTCHGNGVDRKTPGLSQVVKVAGDEEIFRGSFVELLRSRNVSNDLVKRLDESPETAILEEETPSKDAS